MQIKTLEGKLFDLDDDSVTIELNNSLFNDGDLLKGSSSYPISLKLNNNNLLLLGFSTKISSTPKSAEIWVMASISGQSFRKALFSVDLSDGKLEGVLILDLGIINDLLKNTKLSQLPFEFFRLGVDDSSDMEIDANALMAAAQNTDWRVIPYTFAPILAPEFNGEATVPTYDPNRSPYKKLYNLSVPFTNLFTLPSSGTVGYFKTGDQPVWVNNVGGVNNTIYVSFGYTSVPLFYLCYVLHTVCKALGYNATGEVFADKDFKRIVIDNNRPLVTRQRATDYDQAIISGGGGNFIRFSAADHLPDMSLSDFLKKIAALGIRISPDIAQGTISFNWKKSALKGSKASDWSEKLDSIVQTEYENQDGLVFKMETDVIDSLGIESKRTETVTIGNGGTEQKVEFGTLSMVTTPFPKDGYAWALDPNEKWPYNESDTDNMLLPYKASRGMLYDQRYRLLANHKSFTDQDTSKDLILLFYKGMQSFEGSPSYPLLTNESDGFSLYLTGEKGLYNTLLKDWYNRVFACKVIRARFLLSVNDINNLKEDEVILIKDDNNVTVRCLYKQIKFDSGQPGDKFLIAEADLVVLDSQVLSDSIDKRFVLKYEYILVTESPGRRYWDVKVSFFADQHFSRPISVENLLVRYVVRKNTMPRGGQAEETDTNYAVLMNGHTTTISNTVMIDARWPDAGYYKSTIIFMESNAYRIIDPPADTLDVQ